MLGSSKTSSIAKALMPAEPKPDFVPRVKGSNLGASVPAVDPALKALAYGRRKRVKIG